MRRIIVVTIVLLTPALLYGWTKSWGNLFQPRPAGVVVLRDGSAIAAATVGSRGLLLRVAADGTLSWSRSLDRVNTIQFVARAANDDVFLGGFDADPTQAGHVIAWIGRFHADGHDVWVRKLDNRDNLLLRGGAATRDGGVIVCGGTHLQSWVVKLTAAGAIEWQRFFDAPQKDYLNAIVQTRDGGYLAGGHAVDAVLVKLSARGDVEWRHGYGAGGHITALAERPDGGIFAAGGVANGTFVVRVSAQGDVVWQQVTPPIREDEAYDALLLPSGNVLVVAVTTSYVESGNAIMLMELSPSGDIVRQSVAEQGIPKSTTVAHYGAIGSDGALFLLTASGDSIRLRRMENAKPAAIDCWSVSSATMKKLPGFSSVPEWARVDEKVSIAPHQIASAAMEMTAGPACTAPGMAGVKRERPPAIDAARAALEQFEIGMQQLLVAKKFERLDQIAKDLRRDMPLYRTLTSKLEIFYSGLASAKLTARIGRDRHLALIREWIAKSPKSPAARIALAETMNEIAWSARGGGFADTISEHGGEVYASFEAQAAKVLAEAATVASVDPEYFKLQVILHTMTPPEAVHAASKLPFYGNLYLNAVNYSMGKWGGTPKELHAVLDEAAKSGGPRYGAALWGVAGWELLRMRVPPADVVNVWGLPWERIRAGFRAWAGTPPGDVRVPHWFVRCARIMGDRSTARELFQSADLDWSEAAAYVWPSREAYDDARKWALATPVESFTEEAAVARSARSGAAAPKFEKPGSAWPQIVLRSELRLTSGERYDDLSAFLVKTSGGVVAVSAASPLRPNFDPFHSTLRPPNAIDQLRARLKIWTLHAPGASTAFTVRGIAPRSAGILEAGVVLDVGNPKEPPVYALLPRMDALKLNTKVFLLGCPRGDSSCRQNVYTGAVMMEGGGTAIVAFADPIDISAFYGCPIVDEDGRVAAVVSGTRPDRGPMKGGAVVEEMTALLPTAGSGALLPRP